MKIDNVMNNMGTMVYDVLENALIRLGPNLRTSEFPLGQCESIIGLGQTAVGLL